VLRAEQEDRILKKEVPPRKNRIAKNKKGIVTVGENTSAPLVPNGAVWISAPQVCDRYGGRSHMWLERLLRRDKTFPRPTKFGRLRFFKIEELVAWERQAAVRSRAA
jgi:hypothetical protein